MYTPHPQQYTHLGKKKKKNHKIHTGHVYDKRHASFHKCCQTNLVIKFILITFMEIKVSHISLNLFSFPLAT